MGQQQGQEGVPPDPASHAPPQPDPAALPRTIRLERRARLGQLGVFSICVGSEVALYPFREIPCFIGGRGFIVQRWGTRRCYHVRVGKPDDCSCECLGFIFRRRCRHVQGLRTLIRRGKV